MTSKPEILQVVASCLDTLGPVILQDFADKEDLALCLKASANIPVIAGPPMRHRQACKPICSAASRGICWSKIMRYRCLDEELADGSTVGNGSMLWRCSSPQAGSPESKLSHLVESTSILVVEADGW